MSFLILHLLGKEISFYCSCKWIKQITAGGAFHRRVMPFLTLFSSLALNTNSNRDFSYTGGTALQLIPIVRVLVHVLRQILLSFPTLSCSICMNLAYDFSPLPGFEFHYDSKSL